MGQGTREIFENRKNLTRMIEDSYHWKRQTKFDFHQVKGNMMFEALHQLNKVKIIRHQIMKEYFGTYRQQLPVTVEFC